MSARAWRHAGVLGAVLWVGLWVTFASACSTTPSYFDTLTQTPTNTFLSDQPLHAAMLDAQPDRYASAIVRYPTSLANVEGGLPIVVPPTSRPIGDKPFTLGWTTRPTAPPDFPSARVALLATLKPPPPAQPIPGGRGGMLQVPPDYVFMPDQVPWLFRDGGRVRFDMTFLRQLAGLRVWVQLIVEDHRTPAGVTVAPMVELTVGTK